MVFFKFIAMYLRYTVHQRFNIKCKCMCTIYQKSNENIKGKFRNNYNIPERKNSSIEYFGTSNQRQKIK